MKHKINQTKHGYTRYFSFLLISSFMFYACGGLELGSSSIFGWVHPSSNEASINPAGSEGQNPKIAFNNNNEGSLVWEQEDGSGDNQAFISFYKNGVWTHPSDLSDNISLDGENIEQVVHAMDDDGNIIVAMTQYNGSENQVYLSEYRDGTWTYPADLMDSISVAAGTAAYDVEVAMNNNGEAVVVWVQYDGTADDNIYLSEYRNGSWMHPADLDDHINPDGGFAYDVEVEMNDQGVVLVTWVQYDPVADNDNVYLSEYRNGSWTHPADLDDHISPDGENAVDPELDINSKGDAIVVWSQHVDGVIDDQVFMSHYKNGSWTHPADLTDYISPGETDADDPEVALDNKGNAIITWNQDNGSQDHIYMSEYRNGTWTHPADIDDHISPSTTNSVDSGADDAIVQMDDKGEAIIVWEQEYDDEDDRVYMSEYRDGQWIHPKDIDDHISPGTSIAQDPKPVMLKNGKAFITWEQEDDLEDDQIFLSTYEVQQVL
ncbi:hypothetical protein MRY82_10695 [bacterium]|nr:hypothetical protein [bacterium]